MRKPEEFFKFYRDKMLCDTAKPNAAHLKLAEMEQTGKLKAVITQNIDNLHQMAGETGLPGNYFCTTTDGFIFAIFSNGKGNLFRVYR